jgi:hypothetical protein
MFCIRALALAGTDQTKHKAARQLRPSGFGIVLCLVTLPLPTSTLSTTYTHYGPILALHLMQTVADTPRSQWRE